jgi:TonB-linked SusC/RagA family outer membrane protein
MKGINWQKEVFGRTGTSLYNNLSVNGGNKDVKYNISLTRNDEKEIMFGSGYDRTNFTTKLNFKVNKWLSLDMNLRMSDYKLDGAGTYSNYRLPHIVQFMPIKGMSEYIDSSMSGDDYELNLSYLLEPLKQTKDDYRRTENQAFNYNGAMNVQLAKNLTYRFEFGTQYAKNSTNRFYGVNTWNVYYYAKQPIASVIKDDGSSLRIANTLTYSKKNFIPNNNITMMVGEELYHSQFKRLTSSVKYLPKYIDPEGAFAKLNLGIPDPNESDYGTPLRLSSFFGRLNYDYKSRYLATFTLRADGSSKFAPGNQWGYFPSAGLAWRVSEESFVSNLKWIDDLKLRASYGEAGNNRITDDAWRKTFSIYTGKMYMEGNEENPSMALVPDSRLSNPNLKWETTITRNLGMDFSLFKQRIGGTIEVYKNTTEDLLISAAIPQSSGYTMQWQNIGQTSNRGLEISLNAVLVQKKDFRFSVSGNISFNRNKIDKLGETKRWEQSSAWDASYGPTGDYLIEEGGQIGLMYGYVTDGMYSFDDFYYDYDSKKYTLKEGVPDNSSLIGALRFGPGSLKFVNQNPEDGTSVDESNDKVVIGNANPLHSGGFTLTTVYKGFDFSAFFNWVYGNDIYNANKLSFTNYKGYGYFKNMLGFMHSGNRFSDINPETGVIVTDPDELANLNQNKTYWSASMFRTPLHSWAIEDGSFLRLNNLTIGYSLPKNILKKLKIEQLRLYVTGYNLWVWTKYSGYDPEVDAVRSTPLTPGIDYSAYPRSRNYNIGMNFTF